MARLLSQALTSEANLGAGATLFMALALVSAVITVLGMCTLKQRSSVSKTTVPFSPESDGSSDRSGPLERCITPLTPRTLKKLQWMMMSKKSKRQELLQLDEEYRKQEDVFWESSGAVWQRAILMGEKCEPPAFSGLILYDERGQRVPEFPAKSPRAARLAPVENNLAE